MILHLLRVSNGPAQCGKEKRPGSGRTGRAHKRSGRVTPLCRRHSPVSQSSTRRPEGAGHRGHSAEPGLSSTQVCPPRPDLPPLQGNTLLPKAVYYSNISQRTGWKKERSMACSQNTQKHEVTVENCLPTPITSKSVVK